MKVKRKIRSLLVSLLCAMLLAGVLPTVALAEDQIPTDNPRYTTGVSRSKTATPLDTATWTSDVTLSLPSAEEKLDSDVVFVLDGSSSADSGVVDASLSLLRDLKDAAEDSGAAVNVCVVKFKRQAYKSDWFDLSTNYDAIKAAMGIKYSGGTNIHAGLLAGKAALAEHPKISPNKKHLVFVSDGSTYLYSKDGKWDSDTPFSRTYYTKELRRTTTALPAAFGITASMSRTTIPRSTFPGPRRPPMWPSGRHTWLMWQKETPRATEISMITTSIMI